MNTKIEFDFVNVDLLPIIDVLKKATQQDIDEKSPDELLKEVSFSSDLIALSHSCSFAKVTGDGGSINDLLYALSSIQAVIPSMTKELFFATEKDLYFSVRLLELLQKSGAAESNNFIEDNFDKIKESAKELVSFLKNPLIAYEVDDLVVLIGKAHRETWDVLNDINYVYSAIRLMGCYEKGDKFSGFVVIPKKSFDFVKELFTKGFKGVVEDLGEVFKLETDGEQTSPNKKE